LKQLIEVAATFIAVMLLAVGGLISLCYWTTSSKQTVDSEAQSA
jgi:hypothetical protein